MNANKMNCELMLTYDTPALRQTGSRNLTGQKMLPTIWGTYMKLVTKYQISAINSCWGELVLKLLKDSDNKRPQWISHFWIWVFGWLSAILWLSDLLQRKAPTVIMKWLLKPQDLGRCVETLTYDMSKWQVNHDIQYTA